MSADGEINISVKAEGTDEAAEELSEADGGGGGGVTGGGGGGGEGGLRANLQSGAIAGALLSALGPLIDILSPMLKILQAFLAPVATLLLRLFRPVLAGLIRILPHWLSFMDTVSSGLERVINFAQNLAGKIKNFVMDLPGEIKDFVTNLPGDIKDKLTSVWGWLSNGPVELAQEIGSELADLPRKIANKILAALPGVSAPNQKGNDGNLIPDRNIPFTDTSPGDFRPDPGDILGNVNANVQVDTDPDDFINVVERNSGIDLG